MIGRYFVLEGMDGSGKSTQHKMLCDQLEGDGYQVVRTAEPTKGSIGLKIRKILGGKAQAAAMELARMFYQDRRGNNINVVNPAIERGDIVVSDRCFYSTVAYQATQGLPVRDLEALHNEFSPTVPNRTAIVSVEPEDLMARLLGRSGNKEIFEKRDFLDKLQWHYMKTLHEMFPDHDIRHVDGSGSVRQVHEIVWQTFEPLLPPLQTRHISKAFGSH